MGWLVGALVASSQAGKAEYWGKKDKDQNQSSQTKRTKQKRLIFSVSREGSRFPGIQFKLAASLFLEV